MDDFKRHKASAAGKGLGIVKKPKALSWAGHQEAIRMSAAAAAKGRGQQAYRSAVKVMLAAERINAMPSGEVRAKLAREVAADRAMMIGKAPKTGR